MAAVLLLLRRRPHFRRLWLGSVVSQLGDWIGWVAVVMVALHDGGGPLDVALVFVAHHLPAAALAPIAGVVADHVDRRRLLWGTSVALGLVKLGMAFAAGSGALGLLQMLLVIRSGGVAFLIPPSGQRCPGRWRRTYCSPVRSTRRRGACGGALSILGPSLALTIDAATFALSALFFFGLPELEPASTKHRPRLLHGIRDAKTPLALAGGAAWLLLALKADDLTGAAMGGLGFGLLHAVRGVGTGIGPFVVARWVAHGAERLRSWRVAYWLGLVGAAALGILGSA